MLFKNLVISDTTYELAFQESEPIFVYAEGVYGDDRQQDRDTQTGYPLWRVRVTATDATNREEQTIEVTVALPTKPEAGFKEKVLLPNLRVQAYSRRAEKGINTMWFADGFAAAADAPKSTKTTAKAAA